MDLITAKLAFVVLAALGLGLWQLWDINRELKKDASKADSQANTKGPEAQKQPAATGKNSD